MNRKPLRLHLFVLGLYALLSLILTWPLAARLSTHVPGVAQWAFDESTFVWNIWYFKHALVDQLSNPLHSELIWYPLGIDLILYTYNFFHALAAQPLMLAFNLPAASNMALLLSTVLSGYGTWLLVRYLMIRDVRFNPGAGTNHAQEQPDRQSSLLLSLPFLSGALYAFASNRAVYAALGHYDMVTTQWIPFYALMLLRMLDGRLRVHARRRAAILAGIFFAFNGLAEMITAVFLAIFTLIVLADYLWRLRSERRIGRSHVPVATGTDQRAGLPNFQSSVANVALLGAVAFLLWAPALVPILVQFLTDDFSLKGWGEAIPLSTDLLGWFTPTVLHPIFGGDLIAELRRVQLRALEMGVTGFRDVNTVFIGWVSLILALIGAVTWRSRVRIWIWTAVIFGLFTLGPFLQINGRYRFDLDGVEATFPMPYALLHYIPVIKANRAPNRNSVLLMLAVAVLAGYGAWWMLRKLEARRLERRRPGDGRGQRVPGQSSMVNLQWSIAVLLTGLVIFEHLALPAPLSDARVPAVYDEIAADPAAVSVMQVPLGWRNSFGVLGPERTQLQYFQTAHGKPMLGGNISRAPDFKMDYFARIPFFDALTQVEFGRAVDEATLAAARGQAAELMYLYNTEYVLLYPPIPQRFPYADHWQDAWAFVKETVPLEEQPFWSEDGIEAYRVVQPAGDDAFLLDLGEAGTFPYRGEGWDTAEIDTPYETPAVWALGDASRVFVPLRMVDPAATYTLSLRVRPFAYPGSPGQTVTATVNGTQLDGVSLVDDWQELSWPVPGTLLLDGLNRVELKWAQAASPRAVIGGGREIGTTGVTLPIDADLKAFADGGFIALFDDVGEQTDASAGRRGVNVTVLDQATGRVLDQTGFDTAANDYESQALVDFLAGVDPGRIVLVVSSGDATAYLTDAAVAALRGIGADFTPEQLAGQYFSAIGVQGAAPGSAAQVVDPVDAFLSVSLNRDRRPLAAAVDWIRIE